MLAAHPFPRKANLLGIKEDKNNSQVRLFFRNLDKTRFSFTTKYISLLYLGTNGLRQEAVLGTPGISLVIIDL